MDVIIPDWIIQVHNMLSTDAVAVIDRRQNGDIFGVGFEWRTAQGKVEHSFNLEVWDGKWIVGGNIVGDFEKIPEIGPDGFDFTKDP